MILSQESGARLARSLPLPGSDIECYIAAAANPPRSLSRRGVVGDANVELHGWDGKLLIVNREWMSIFLFDSMVR